MRNLIITVMAAGLLAAGLASAASSSSSDNDRTAYTDQTVAVESVQPDIRTRFAIFREQPATPMPAKLAEQIASPHRYGRNADLARSIRTPYGTGYVIPGDGHLCIAVPDPVDGFGESCVDTETATQLGLWVRLVGDGPDAKAMDTIVMPDGTTLEPGAEARNTAAGTNAVSRIGRASDQPPRLQTAE